MFSKQKLALFLLGLGLVTVLCACGDSTTSDDTNSDETSSSEKANSIVVGISQDLGNSLDPYQMTAAGTREVLFNVYEGLVKPNSDGEFIPAVAAALPEISEDGTVYTFTLRENVKFHSGEVVTAEDVVKSFETCAATTVDTALAAALSDVLVEATDESTIVITLPEAVGDTLSNISSVYIVPADYEDQSTSPIGTGPYAFVSRSIQDNVVLEKFDAYWGTPAYIDTITLKIYEDVNTKMAALSAGTIDLANHLSVDQISALDANEFKTVEGTMNLVQALYLNNAAEPFDNQLVREALNYAVDVEEILALTAEGHGSPVGTSIYPAFGKYFDETLVDVYACDTEKAMALLEEAGYPNGFSMSITVPSNYTPHIVVAEVLVEQLARVGITATLDLVEWNTWLNDTYIGRDFESTVIGFDAVSLTAGALLDRWMSTDESNMINYNHPDYDALMLAAKASTDDEEATALYREAAALLSSTAANVYIQDMADYVVMKTDLDGYVFYPFYVMDLSTIHYVD